jgi:hypothetical protein
MDMRKPLAADNRRQPSPGRRTTPKARYEAYLTLARAEALAGDRIEAERHYQHAEHFHRLMTESARTQGLKT